MMIILTMYTSSILFIFFNIMGMVEGNFLNSLKYRTNFIITLKKCVCKNETSTANATHFFGNQGMYFLQLMMK